MPTVEPQDTAHAPPDGSRFAQIADPELPLYFDPRLVAALEAKPDGRWAMHLAGGQVITIRPAIAAAALKRLGLPVPKAKRAKEGRRDAETRGVKVRQPAKPRGRLAKIGDALLRYADRHSR